jgi:hypothetical protein
MKNWIASHGGEVRSAGPDSRKQPGMIGLVCSSASRKPQTGWGRAAQFSLPMPWQTGWVVEGERGRSFQGGSMRDRYNFIEEIDVPSSTSEQDWVRIRRLFPEATLFREVAGPFCRVPFPK